VALSEQFRSTLTLLTVNEVADILKLNPQVVSRKLAKGEIEGYKLGKDWRVSEKQLVDYLEAHSNRSDDPAADKVLKIFMPRGKLKEIPAQRKKRDVVLRHIVSTLDPMRVYPEKELNQLLAAFHSDVCTLRREMIMTKLMVRKDGNYKVVAGRP
jgi:excisionase family DNA binding protein